MAKRVIMGVDPGLTRCGIAVIEAAESRKVAFRFVDTVRAPLDWSLERRIGHIAEDLERSLKLFKPDVIAIERVFAQANLRSVMGIAQISGVLLYLANKYSIPVHMHTPSEVKAAVTGSGRAAKTQIGTAVARILELSEIPKPADSADALAIAITQAWRGAPLANTGELTKAQAAWLKAERASKSKPKV